MSRQKTAMSSYVSEEFKQSNTFSNFNLDTISFCSALGNAQIANLNSDKIGALFKSSFERFDTAF